jgi:hypothetical protein
MPKPDEIKEETLPSNEDNSDASSSVQAASSLEAFNQGMEALANPSQINRANSQSTHGETEKAIITKNVLRLSNYFKSKKIPLLSIKSIRHYIKTQQKNLVSNDSSNAIESADHITENQKNDLLAFLRKLKKENIIDTPPSANDLELATFGHHHYLMCLAWTAIHDENINELIAELKNGTEEHRKLLLEYESAWSHIKDKDELIKAKILQFFKIVTSRLEENVCPPGQYNLIYEGLQSLHPYTPLILDEAAFKLIVSKYYSDELKFYLEESTDKDLVKQLKIIEGWLEKSSECQPIVAAQVKREIIAKIREKLLIAGYTQDFSFIDAYFSNRPPFLFEFDLLATTYDIKKVVPNPMYIPAVEATDIATHIKIRKQEANLEKDLAESLSQYWSGFNEIAKKHKDNIISYLLQELIYTPITIINEQPTLSEKAFLNIYKKLRSLEMHDKLTCFLKVVQKKAAGKLKIKACLFLFEIYLSRNELSKAFNGLEEFGNGDIKHTMWMLCYLYYTSLWAERDSLKKLILFLHKQGIHAEQCYYHGRSAADYLLKVKDKNLHYAILSEQTLLKKFKKDNPLYGRGTQILGILAGTVLTVAGLITVALIATSVAPTIPIVAGLSLVGCITLFITIIPIIEGIVNYLIKKRMKKKIQLKIEENKKSLDNTPSLSDKVDANQENLSKHNIYKPIFKLGERLNKAFSMPYTGFVDFFLSFKQPYDGTKHLTIGFLMLFFSPIQLLNKNGFAAMKNDAAEGALKIYQGLIEFSTFFIITVPSILIRTGLTIYNAATIKKNLSAQAATIYNNLAKDSTTTFAQLMKQLTNLHSTAKKYNPSITERKAWQDIKNFDLLEHSDDQATFSTTEQKAIHSYLKLFIAAPDLPPAINAESTEQSSLKM